VCISQTTLRARRLTFSTVKCLQPCCRYCCAPLVQRWKKTRARKQRKNKKQPPNPPPNSPNEPPPSPSPPEGPPSPPVFPHKIETIIEERELDDLNLPTPPRSGEASANRENSNASDLTATQSTELERAMQVDGVVEYIVDNGPNPLNKKYLGLNTGGKQRRRQYSVAQEPDLSTVAQSGQSSDVNQSAYASKTSGIERLAVARPSAELEHVSNPEGTPTSLAPSAIRLDRNGVGVTHTFTQTVSELKEE